MKTEKFVLPTYIISALVNADFSGLTDEEEREINDFIADNQKPGCRFYCLCPDGEEYFSHTNDLNNLGGTVMDVFFDVTPTMD